MRDLAFLILVFVATSIIVLIASSSGAQSAVPMLINYQGELRSPTTGQPMPDGSYDMIFRIYDVQFAGTPIWTGTHSAANGNPVQVNNGIFSVIRGSGTSNALDASVFDGADRWLGIQVGTEALSPRQRITSVVYSLVSKNSRLLGGNDASAFIIQTQGLRLEPNATSPNIIAGCLGNTVAAGAVGATISGGGFSGSANSVTDSFSTIGGGRGNQAGDNAETVDSAMYATVGGGLSNTASRGLATVSGGDSNVASDWYATVAGGRYNQARARYATIAGGGPSDPYDRATANLVTDDYGTIGGGGNNQAGDNAGTTSDRTYATVAGGENNTASGVWATVGGGGSNTASGANATVAGGALSTASGGFSSVGGGINNQAGSRGSAVGGGENNIANGLWATVAGGGTNTAFGHNGMVPGGAFNDADGRFSFAAGYKAKAEHDGSCVWADFQEFDFPSTANNEFSARCAGGARFVSAIDSKGVPSAGVLLKPGGGSWSSISDQALKDNVTAVDRKSVLDKLVAMPMAEWNYKAQDASIRHMGPMAQDFYAAFGLGEDDKHIATVDADGVALAAIQGLNEIVQEKQDRISTLEKRNAELEERLAALEALVETLVKERKDGRQ